MKLLTSTLTANFYYLSILEIANVPFTESPPSIDLLRTLYNTTEGKADVSLEFLRIASNEVDHPIRHFVVLRAMDADAAACRVKAKHLYQVIHDFLLDSGYGCHEVDYQEFNELYTALPRDQTRFICRDICKDHTGLLRIPQIEKVDMPSIYSALAGSGCSFSMHITPSKTTSAEAGYLHSMGHLYRGCCDSHALNLLSQRSAMLHTFSITLCVSGEHVTGVATRLAAALDIPTVILPADKNAFSLPEQPWLRNKSIDEQMYLRCKTRHGIGDPPKFCGLFTKFTPNEAAQLLSLPVADKGYVGVRSNIFSLLKHSTVWDEKLTVDGPNSMLVGLSQRGLPLYLPFYRLCRGTGIFGMNGVGKSVLLLSAIQQLCQKKYDVLVLAAAKREMRKLVRHSPCKFYTPGNSISPMKLNVFEVPEGSTVAQHKTAIVTTLASAVNLPSPLDSLLYCAVGEAYEAFGFQPNNTWKDGRPFSIRDFLPIYKAMLARSTYRGEVRGNLDAAAEFRLLGLLQRADGMMDAIHNTIDAKSLISGLSVVEFEGLEPCDRKLAAFLILTSVMAYIRSLPETCGKLRLAIVIDEAHALLSDDADASDAERLASSAIRRLMVDLISTMRSRGIALIYSDQSPNRIGGNALFDQTVNKFLFRLEGEENHLASRSLHFTEKESKALLNLGVGQCLLKTDLDMEAIGVTTIFKDYGANVSDEELRRLTLATQPKTDPAQIAVRLLQGGSFPRPVALFQAMNELDTQTAKAFATDLQHRAIARGVPIPQEYSELMRRYFAARQERIH